MQYLKSAPRCISRLLPQCRYYRREATKESSVIDPNWTTKRPERPPLVRIIEVAPGDGLEYEKSVSIEDRIKLINMLSVTGIQDIEAAGFGGVKSFESDTVLRCITPRLGVRYPVFVASIQGVHDAIAAGATDISISISASETSCLHTYNHSSKNRLSMLKEICAIAESANVPIRGHVDCIMACRWDGPTAPKTVVANIDALLEMGCFEVCLVDNLAYGTSYSTTDLLRTISQTIPPHFLAVHFHDTFGQGLVNVLVAIEMGITAVESAVAGLGACPFTPSNTGNLATEDLVFMLNGMGVCTGVDMTMLLHASAHACKAVGRVTTSKTAQALFGIEISGRVSNLKHIHLFDSLYTNTEPDFILAKPPPEKEGGVDPKNYM